MEVAEMCQGRRHMGSIEGAQKGRRAQGMENQVDIGKNSCPSGREMQESDDMKTPTTMARATHHSDAVESSSLERPHSDELDRGVQSKQSSAMWPSRCSVA